MSKQGKNGNPALEVRSPRRYTAEYKRDILEQLDAVAGQPGETGKLLRREVLYASLIFRWRKQRDEAARLALGDKKRGPKVDAVAAENKRLKERIERLEGQLGVAEELAAAQGKAFTLLQELSRQSNENK